MYLGPPLPHIGASSYKTRETRRFGCNVKGYRGRLGTPCPHSHAYCVSPSLDPFLPRQQAQSCVDALPWFQGKIEGLQHSHLLAALAGAVGMGSI